jgi:hypothetical protein
MPKFIVHIRHHAGWRTTEAEGSTFGEAAIAAVIATNKQYGLDVNDIPHTVSFNERDEYRSVVFRETSRRPVFGGATHPGELWFADQVREGKADDCEKCGGTGSGVDNPFVQCWACGDRKLKGKSSGKKQALAVA